MSIDTWVGVDETVISTGGGNLIVAAAVTHNPELSKNLGFRKLKKSKDILREAGAYSSEGVVRVKRIPEFPSIEEMKATGLDSYHWVKANPGRFPRAMIEHAAIAHTLLKNGYNPKTTFIMIDAFYTRHDHSIRLIHRYMEYHGFNIPIKNIDIFGWGDQSVPIINYADLLAFQIGLGYNKKYARFGKGITLDLPYSPEVNFNEKRVLAPLGETERFLLEEIIKEVNS